MSNLMRRLRAIWGCQALYASCEEKADLLGIAHDILYKQIMLMNELLLDQVKKLHRLEKSGSNK